jgi:twitching motility two-component system response regulator PilG
MNPSVTTQLLSAPDAVTAAKGGRQEEARPIAPVGRCLEECPPCIPPLAAPLLSKGEEVTFPATAGEAKPAIAYTILVVDDSPTIRTLVALTLEKYGHQVMCAQDGQEALHKVQEVVPDLILSDITMPHLDGYQLCRMIRSNAVTRSVPVIMFSGESGIFDKLRGQMVGATAYITKPFALDSLLQLIALHCQPSAERREAAR